MAILQKYDDTPYTVLSYKVGQGDTWPVEFNAEWMKERDREWLDLILTEAFASVYELGRKDMRKEISYAQRKLHNLIQGIEGLI